MKCIRDLVLSGCDCHYFRLCILFIEEFHSSCCRRGSSRKISEDSRRSQKVAIGHIPRPVQSWWICWRYWARCSDWWFGRGRAPKSLALHFDHFLGVFVCRSSHGRRSSFRSKWMESKAHFFLDSYRLCWLKSSSQGNSRVCPLAEDF